MTSLRVQRPNSSYRFPQICSFLLSFCLVSLQQRKDNHIWPAFPFTVRKALGINSSCLSKVQRQTTLHPSHQCSPTLQVLIFCQRISFGHQDDNQETVNTTSSLKSMVTKGQGFNFQSIQIAHTTQQQKNRQPN